MTTSSFYVELTNDGRYAIMCRRLNKRLAFRDDISKDDALEIVKILEAEVNLGPYQL